MLPPQTTQRTARLHQRKKFNLELIGYKTCVMLHLLCMSYIIYGYTKNCSLQYLRNSGFGHELRVTIKPKKSHKAKCNPPSLCHLVWKSFQNVAFQN